MTTAELSLTCPIWPSSTFSVNPDNNRDGVVALLKYPVPTRGIRKDNTTPTTRIHRVAHALIPVSAAVTSLEPAELFLSDRYMSKLINVDTSATRKRTSVTTKERSIVKEDAARTF